MLHRSRLIAWPGGSQGLLLIGRFVLVGPEPRWRHAAVFFIRAWRRHKRLNN
ncbi:hypothetical protein SynBMKMC1_02556 [Synechococcus sp. BMK-MC-1]|nr:hypothetical protein SynBMKMC1_02556 [Synechococcus sp. BMK-MC-1]